MSLVEERFRFLIDSVHGGDLAKFKEELSKTGVCADLLQLQHCRYAKSQDNIIMLLCKLGRVDFLEVLVDHANDNQTVLEFLFNLSNSDGKTPLHEAAQFSQPQTVKFLLDQHCVKIDPIKRADWTPLMLACTKTGPNAVATVQILLDHGANHLLENKVFLSCKNSLFKNEIRFSLRTAGRHFTWQQEKETWKSLKFFWTKIRKLSRVKVKTVEVLFTLPVYQAMLTLPNLSLA